MDLLEIRQCQIEGHREYGSSATKNPENGKWLMARVGGGYWTMPNESEEIETKWTPLVADPTWTPPEPPSPPSPPTPPMPPVVPPTE